MVIYGLAEPTQRWNIRYIGAARRVTRRYGRHLDSRDHTMSAPLRAWLDTLETREQLPELVILDRAAPGEDWRALEAFHIAAHAQAGFSLLNILNCGGLARRRHLHYKLGPPMGPCQVCGQQTATRRLFWDGNRFNTEHENTVLCCTHCYYKIKDHRLKSLPALCQVCGEMPALDRYWRDGRRGNMVPDNLVLCCRRCYAQLNT